MPQKAQEEISVLYNPVATYLQEAEELLGEIEQSALLLDAEGTSRDAIDHLFRIFHTIKGSGAMVGLDAVAGFTHHVENLLERVRSGSLKVTPELTDVVLKSGDHIKTLLNSVQNGGVIAPDSTASLIALINQFAHAGQPEKQLKVIDSAARKDEAHSSAERTWRIAFHPNPRVLLNGAKPEALLNELRQLGACEVTGHTGDVPPLDTLQPDLCYFWWTIELRTAAGLDAIRDVFIFVEDDSRLEIRQIETSPPQQAAATGSTVQPVVQAAPESSGSSPVPANTRKATFAREQTVRVPSERLDHLVNLVGELVMNQSRLAQAVSQSGAPEFANPVQELDRLVAELRDDVLGIRMLPIGTLFGRFHRLVHDLSKDLRKEADLVTEGAETELDKSILDQLGDPLVHCLRNCIDHAVEPPEERLAKGKPRRAVIRLSAVHTGSDVVIRIEDDGRGIDKQAVRAKAIEKQLISMDASLSDREIFNLILMPGFSTARQVTSVSGRGVGMDAIKRQIDALHGSLSLSSEEGHGTRVSISLPLTLAIIDGLLVEIGGDPFIVPMAAVTENVELLAADKLRHNGRNIIAVRGELIPYINLRAGFRIDGDAPAIEKVVLTNYEGNRVGLVVDRVLGTHQTVLQSLGRFLKKIEVVSGATIMGDGRVALVMDIAAVVRHGDAHRGRPGQHTNEMPLPESTEKTGTGTQR